MLDWQRLPVRVASHGAQRISRAELARHCTADDCWMAIAGRVYDVTAYVPFHPGGRAELLRGAGGDATELVRSTHAWVSIDTFIGRCFIGMLEP